MNNQYFRVYTSADTIGAEIGGSLKNVIAIAAGIIDGLAIGDNTKAALITRGLEEIARLGMIERVFIYAPNVPNIDTNGMGSGMKKGRLASTLCILAAI